MLMSHDLMIALVSLSPGNCSMVLLINLRFLYVKLIFLSDAAEDFEIGEVRKVSFVLVVF